MSHKAKSLAHSEISTCEKYLTKMLKQESLLKKQTPRTFQDKFSQLSKQPIVIQPQRLKNKSSARSQSPIQKITTQILGNVHKEFENINNEKESLKSPKTRPRSISGTRSIGKEPWGQLLRTNRSREKVSNFSTFDPLRTLHFLSKELYTKLEGVVPGENELLHMVADIQHALKRIPPEVSTLLHNPQTEFSLDNSGYSGKTSTKICQTPPTLYKEDTERFQKIMEENTYRLEASCKQLEEVCSNLQNEKEITEKELYEARENVEILCRKVKELEAQIELTSDMNIKQLEEDKQYLQEKLEKAKEELRNNPTVIHLKKVIEELTRQKMSADETCTRLEYDMTLLRMEKEKFVTMLAVRDKEIAEIQTEMSKIQEQVNKQLEKLNTETLQRAASIKSMTDPLNGVPENIFLEVGDTTISSITTTDSEKEMVHVIKESPCGDSALAGMTKESQDEMLQKLKAEHAKIDFSVFKQDQNSVIDRRVPGLSSSMETFFKTQNL